MSKINFSTSMKPGGGVKYNEPPKQKDDGVIETHTEVVADMGSKSSEKNKTFVKMYGDDKRDDVRKED